MKRPARAVFCCTNQGRDQFRNCCRKLIVISTPTRIRLTLLGTGSSGGVPRIGNSWGNCDPDNPKNRRRRCSCLIQGLGSGTDSAATTILVDTGPDLREQLLSADVQDLDGVVLTHAHADHIAGIDDLRQLWVRHRRRMDVYMDELTAERMLQAFAYCFEQPPGSSYPPFCNAHRLHANKKLQISGAGGDVDLLPLQVEHGDIHALGIRVGGIAYVPDVKTVDIAESRLQLQGLEVLILDALRYGSHPTHMNVEEALEFIAAVKPQRTVLTNMHGDLDYERLKAELPDSIEPGFDGMVLESDL